MMRQMYALLLLVGCGGKDTEGTDVIQRDLGQDTAGTDTLDSADTAVDTGDTAPAGPFWMTLVLSGGAPEAPYTGQAVELIAGQARLTEDADGFKLALVYSGEVDGTALAATCVVPFDFAGGLPAEAAGEGLGAGCATLTVGADAYDQGVDGLTIVSVNDGSRIEG